MKDILAGIAGVLLLVSLAVGVAFGAPWIQLQVMRMWGTELESVKTDIYRENKSYVEGTVRDLRELHVDYVKADESQKETLASLIIHRSNELDYERLPPDVRNFLKELKENH